MIKWHFRKGEEVDSVLIGETFKSFKVEKGDFHLTSNATGEMFVIGGVVIPVPEDD